MRARTFGALGALALWSGVAGAQAPREGARAPQQHEQRLSKEEPGDARVRALEDQLGNQGPMRPNALASAVFQGEVRQATASFIDVRDEEGNVYHLVVDRQTQVLDAKTSIAPGELPEGTPVLTSFDVLNEGQTLANQVHVLGCPKPAQPGR
jgi:hypothetical protein